MTRLILSYLIAALAFVALFIGLTLIDVERYQPDLIPPAPAQSASSP